MRQSPPKEPERSDGGMKYLDDKGGLSERARRAKMHVRRKYGSNSPEYMAHVNKIY